MGLIFFIYLTLTEIGWMVRDGVNVFGISLRAFMGYMIFCKKPFSSYLRISSRLDVKKGFPSPRNKFKFAFRGT